MPWPPSQARAIAMRYRKSGKEPSAEVERALSGSLKGVPMPKHKKKHRRVPTRLLHAQTARRKR